MQINFDDNVAVYFTLIEESPMPIGLYIGENMNIKVANKAMLKAWGRDNSVIGQELAIALPELKEQPFLEILQNVRKTGIAYETKEDRVMLINDGVLQTFYFDFIYKPLKDNDGNVWGILNNATNVTELVNARLKIKASEELFRKMIQDAPVAIGILRGENFIIEQANADLLKLWGKTEEVVGLYLIDGLPELKGQPFPDLLTQVYQTGVPHYGYETMARLERYGVLQDYYFNFVYDPIRDQHNVVTGIMVVANEITSLVHSRMEMAKSEERFRNLLLDTPMATGYYETEDIIISLANDEMLRFWGKDKSVIGKPIEEAIPELKGQPFINILKEVYRTGIPYHADQQEALLPVNGKMEKLWFNFTYKPLMNAEGKVYAILHAAMDVTKQVRLQQQKDEFLGIASHELKTPVTSIKAYAQVLERMIRNDGDEKKADMVRKMDLQLNRLTGLIGDLLDVTKIQSGKMTFNPIKFDFDQAVREIVDEMQHITSKHCIKTDLNSNAMVYVDRERIGQVITNFLSNAIKYSTDANQIDVSTYALNGEVILCVRDYGIGISKVQQHKVFDQFYRVGGNLQHTYPGLGLGLYISAEIIKNEKGRIWVESEEGQGASFCFALKI
ncbi:PAS domain-containing sensor histidine kinase [Pedobacter alluvionis]|uniref:histidine kinase n=1 Tax=Pedobacter alluvionis TaxID=475253 RepID=A0A497XWS3_9SPHI|nr:PAS domain-containing sensor histidine kinase [Pedobacter alluvionis]RLJ72902.1 two-component system CheB/CheR fusion protein [Pedobacter alluvionis]TFB29269.1 PAS domain-containing sensor histidine kinase [Pedobacter alluvionis]